MLLISAAGNTLFLENFKNLSNWKEVYFPKIPAHTTYTAANDGKESFLRAESQASASVVIYKEAFNPYDYPLMKWKWKIDNILPGADLRSKAGDDAPVRVYVAFAYNPEKSDIIERSLYNSIRILYGEYPPHSSLNYVWASEPVVPDILTSVYTSRSRMIILEKGDKKAGRWVPEAVNIISDYRRAFGANPPEKATVGIMNDSDNTKGHAVSYVTDMAVYR